MKQHELQALANNQRLLKDVLGDALFHRLLDNGSFDKTPALAESNLEAHIDRMVEAIA